MELKKATRTVERVIQEEVSGVNIYLTEDEAAALLVICGTLTGWNDDNDKNVRIVSDQLHKDISQIFPHLYNGRGTYFGKADKYRQHFINGAVI